MVLDIVIDKYQCGNRIHPTQGFLPRESQSADGVGLMLKRISIFVCAVFLCLITAHSASAQIVTGDISGTVTDQSGGSIAGANITAICPDTKLTRVVKSGTVGEYRLTDMPSCVYKVSVSAPGFKTTVREVTVTVAQITKADFSLEVGQNTETVTVESVAPLIDYSPG